MRALLLVLLVAGFVHAKPVRLLECIDLKNAKDPVDGKKVALGQELRWHGVLVHFANPDNTAAFAKSPEKYLAKLKLKMAGKLLSLENAKCPVTGEPAKKEHFVDRNGVRIYLSAADKKVVFNKKPGMHLATLGMALAPSVIDIQNETCPVTGDELYPEAPIWADHDGIRIRMCCDHCIREFRESPKRCFQALMVDPAKLKAKFAAK